MNEDEDEDEDERPPTIGSVMQELLAAAAKALRSNQLDQACALIEAYNKLRGQS